MYKASADLQCCPPRSSGRLPRLGLDTARLWVRIAFRSKWQFFALREQYEGKNASLLLLAGAGNSAGLDICTDGDAPIDEQVAGMERAKCPLPMAGLAEVPRPPPTRSGAVAFRAGHILARFLRKARVCSEDRWDR